jgi:hypothetical protein
VMLKYVGSDCQMELCYNASLTCKFTEVPVPEGYLIPAYYSLCVMVFLYIIFLTMGKKLVPRMDKSPGCLTVLIMSNICYKFP